MGDKKNKFSMVGNAAAGAGLGIGSGLIGGLISDQFNQAAERRQHERTKELNQQLYDLSMKKWFETNYPAQVEQMKKAGLNVGLMYQQGGAGGQSTASGMAGGAGMAPNMDFGGNPMDLALKMKMTNAQANLMDAQAENQKAEAEATRGYRAEESSAKTESLIQGVENQKATQRLTEIQTEIEEINKYVSENTASLNIHKVLNEVNYMEAQIEYLARQNWIDEETKHQKIELVKQEVTANYLEQQLTKARTDLTKAEISNIATQMSKNLAEIHYRGREVDVKEKEIFLKNERINMSEILPTAILDTARRIVGEKK